MRRGPIANAAAEARITASDTDGRSHHMRAAIYTRVSTLDQHTENQIPDLQRFAEARGWTIVQTFTDHGISGSKEKRPGLDAMRVAARRRDFDALIVWRLDRLGRS